MGSWSSENIGYANENSGERGDIDESEGITAMEKLKIHW